MVCSVSTASNRGTAPRSEPSVATVRAVTRRTPGGSRAKASRPGLTATAATCGKHQRPATAHNSRTICANWGYVRPEKQTVGDQRRSDATVANTVAKPLDSDRRTWTTLEYRPSLRPVTDGPGRCAHSYGSDARRRDSRDARKSQVTSRMRVVSVAGHSSITCSA